MKIVAISDTHGFIEDILKELRNIRNIDLIMHLGDYVEDSLEISDRLGIKSIAVKGNGDVFNRDFKEEEILEINNKRIYLTHGHIYNVRKGIQGLYYRGMEENVDLILFGHTHIASLVKESNMIIMNPGSPSFPRSMDNRKTYGILEINEDIDIKIMEVK